MNSLISFSVENFLSFNHKETLNLQDTSIKENILASSVTAIYGANSSGKTTILKAIGFLKLLLNSSSHQRVTDKIPYLPFKLNNGRPTTFEITFISSSNRYKYTISFSENRIFEESLLSYPTQKPKKIFSRKFIEENASYSYEYSREFSSLFKIIEQRNLPNKLFLSTLSEWIDEKEIKEAFDFIQNKIVITVDYENPNWLHYTAQKLQDDPFIKSLFLKLLKEVNPGIKDIKSKIIKKTFQIEDLPSEIPLELKLLMSKSENITTDIKIEYDKNGLILDLSEESRGIQKLFEIGGPILDILRNGNILIFDELETSLHPLLSQKIIELFSEKKYNQFNAQLIFSTHDTNLLNLELLKKEQIYFTEKGEETEYSTILTRLSDLKGIKKSTNLQKGFLQGNYTKIPFLTGLYVNHDFWDNNEKKNNSGSY